MQAQETGEIWRNLGDLDAICALVKLHQIIQKLTCLTLQLLMAIRVVFGLLLIKCCGLM